MALASSEECGSSETETHSAIKRNDATPIRALVLESAIVSSVGAPDFVV